MWQFRIDVDRIRVNGTHAKGNSIQEGEGLIAALYGGNFWMIMIILDCRSFKQEVPIVLE